MKNQIDITIKPTMACNMKCKHCFNGEAFSNFEMLDVNMACIFLEKACKEYHTVKVTFHGGEPTLAGIVFYKHFFSKQQEFERVYGTSFRNIIVTNGLRLTEELVDLLNANHVQVCISFDGPYNHILRQNSEKVLEVISMVKSKGGNFKCYCTLSKGSIMHLEETYTWFRDNKIPFKTLPIEKRGFAKTNDDIIMNPSDLVNQFEKVYTKWLTDEKCNISYSTFEEFAKLRRHMPHRKFWFGRKIAMNPDGRLYTFGRPNDVRFCLGTPDQIQSLEECFNSDDYNKFLSFLEEKRTAKCPHCQSYSTCAGVNINIAYLYVDEEELVDYSCMQSNMLFQRILSVNDKIISDFENNNYLHYNGYIKSIFQNTEGL